MKTSYENLDNNFKRKMRIDRTEEIRNWFNKMKEIRQNEKDVKIVIVAANNHYGGYGQVLISLENMEMEKLPFENVDIAKINRELQLKTKFKIGHRDQGKKIKQTSISDFVN